MNAPSLIQALGNRFPAAVKASHSYRGDATVIVSREFLLEVARALKEDPAFQMNFLVDLTFLVGLCIVTELSRQGDTHSLRMLKISMITFATAIDEACLLKLPKQFSDFTRHCNSLDKLACVGAKGRITANKPEKCVCRATVSRRIRLEIFQGLVEVLRYFPETLRTAEFGIRGPLPP